MTQTTTANFDQSLKEKQAEEGTFRKHAADFEQLIKDESCWDTLMYNVIKDAQSEMKNLFQSCQKTHLKCTTTFKEFEIEDEMEWLINLQKSIQAWK